MITTMVISLREFLEVFLIIGVFLGISKKLKIKREKEIILASVIGVIISLLLPITVFLLGDKARVVLTEKNAELLEGYLMVFSGFFIAYVIFSLHNFFVLKRSKSIITTHQKLQQNIFDLSLFFTIVFFIIREGFEIALFTATVSLFSKFIENLAGLFAVIVAFSESSTLALYVLTFFVVVQQLENHVLIPLFMGRTMKVHPVIVTISLLAGGQVAGFVGIFLAVPIAVLSQEIFNYMAEAKERRIGNS